MKHPVLFQRATAVWKAEGLGTLLRKIILYAELVVMGENAYQRPIIKCIRRVGGRDSTFIDIGGHKGLVSIAAAPFFRSCLIIEPLPENASEIARKLERSSLTNCKVVERAVSDKPGKGLLWFSRDDRSKASLAQQEDLVESVNVEVTTVDKVVAEEGLVGPFVLKLDIQGYEYIALKGASTTISNKCAIVSEFWPWGIRTAGCSPTEFVEFMSKSGFIACHLDGQPIAAKRLTRMCELGASNQFVTSDILFKRPD